MTHSCERCHYKASRKHHMLDHLQRNNPCQCLFTDTPREDLIASLSTDRYSCEYCDKIYTSRKYLDNHLMKCTNAKIDAFSRKVQELKEIVEHKFNHNDSLMVNSHNSTATTDNSTATTDNSTVTTDNSIVTTDNSTTIIDNSIAKTTTTNISKITINNFGSEDRSYVKNNIIQECVETARVIPLIMDVYFNSDHPENHTIKLKSEKLSRVVVHNEGKWIECDMNSSIDSMMQLERNSMTNYYWMDVASDPNVTDKFKLDTLQNIGNFCKTSLKYFEERRNIHAILKNARNESNESLR